jgi:copper transport protein
MPVMLEGGRSLHTLFDVGAPMSARRAAAASTFVDLGRLRRSSLRPGSSGRPARPGQPIRIRRIGVVAAAAAVVLIPGTAGHAAQTSPRGLAVALDWLHVASGSLWVGGLAGLVLLWATLPHARRVAGLAVVVPRFSNVALVSVAVLLGSGIWASVLKLPILSALWTTSYGQTILVKARSRSRDGVRRRHWNPGESAARPRRQAEVGPPAVSLLGDTSGEVLVVIGGAIAAAAVLTARAALEVPRPGERRSPRSARGHRRRRPGTGIR